MRSWASFQMRAESIILRGWQWFFGRSLSLSNRIIGVILITASCFFLSDLMQEELHFSTVPLIGAILASLYGGFWLGLLATSSMGMAIDYFFIPPVGEMLGTSEERWTFSIIMFFSIGTGLLSSSLRFSYLKIASAKQEADRARRQAEAAVRSRDELVGVISHELKNPLTAVQTGVAMIRMSLPVTLENEKAMKFIERLQPSIARMSHLVSDLLDVTRLEAKALKVEPRQNDLQQIVREVVRSYDASAEEKLVQLSESIPPECAHVYCDATRTAQILANLTGNAIKFTNEGGSVRISAVRFEECVEVRIADTGKGIRPDHLPHIFDRFWQARETAYKGTGLGLAIAKGLVEAQDGKIWADSRVGAGSTFHFTLPVKSTTTAASNS